jgi:hypothetical protein
MICRDFSLEPCPEEGLAQQLQITGRVTRCSSRLSVAFQLLGPLSEVLIPPRAETPARKTRLWERTCFELFLASENSDAYWEFNLSPAGHWNVYRFSGYRQSMQEEKAFSSLPFVTLAMGDTLLLKLDLDTDKILTDCNLEAGVSAVIESRDGKRTYWALAHCGPRPDFHLRNCFVIQLPCPSEADVVFYK